MTGGLEIGLALERSSQPAQGDLAALGHRDRRHRRLEQQEASRVGVLVQKLESSQHACANALAPSPFTRGRVGYYPRKPLDALVKRDQHALIYTSEEFVKGAW